MFNNMYAVNKAATDAATVEIWSIISLVVAIIGGITLFFTFLSKKNDNHFKGFWGWLYDFLSFKKMLIENILKICYLIFTIFITLSSFSFISINFLAFVGVLVLRKSTCKNNL